MLSNQRRSPSSPGAESIQTGSLASGSVNPVQKPKTRESSSSDESIKAAVVPVAIPIQSKLSEASNSRESSRKNSPAKISAVSPPSNYSSDSSANSSPAPTPKPIAPLKPTTNIIQTPLQKPIIQPKSSEDKKQTTSVSTKMIKLNPGSKQSTKDPFVRVSLKDFQYDSSELVPIANSRDNEKYVSIFEKVDTHDGLTTYLGSGTFSQLEHCIINCLARERHCRDTKYHSKKYDYPLKSLVRASILEDYNYDGVISSYHQIGDSHNHHHSHHRKKSAAELSLGEIRQINDALAKYGIPVFSNQPNPYNSHPPQHNIGEIISACRLLIEDPSMANLANKHSAVSHVWDAARFGQSSPPSAGGYASPAVQAVASHLFNHSQQPPYNPTQSVLSHLFPGQPSLPPPQHFVASSYNNPPNPHPGSHPYPY